MDWISTASGEAIPINTKLLLGWRSRNQFKPEDEIDIGMWTGKNWRLMDTEQPTTTPDYWMPINKMPTKQYRQGGEVMIKVICCDCLYTFETELDEYPKCPKCGHSRIWKDNEKTRKQLSISE